PGVALAIERRGEIIFREAFGLADIENQIAVRPDAVFPIGSITKTMTGLSIMQLVAQGRLSIDDRAGQYMDDLPPTIANIKVRNLLDHTSGIIGYTDLPDFPLQSQRPFSREEMLGWFVNRPLQFEPGARWSYTNSGIFLLGLIIERVSGLTYADYLQQNIFAPFGMSQSSMAGWETIVPNRARGYMRTPQGLRNGARYDPLVPFSAGAVLSTLDDMLRYRRGVFGDGPTSAPVRRLLLQRDTLRDGTRLPYALGCLAVTEFEGRRKIGHPGDIFGFSSQYAYYPEDDLTIVLLTNIQGGLIPPTSLEQKIARAALGIRQPVITDTPLTTTQANAYVGGYEIGSIRFAVNHMRFVFANDTLNVSFDGSDDPSSLLPLRHQGRGEFVSIVDDEHRFRFERRGRARKVFMSYYGSVFEASAT
ncbi:MAG TPA: serine hydrolase domain-containing protein, partial [Verrucomicrobiae bacterium]|nr:serine hydrolase domain-containing protein [Verrucomicrobiae bacterium]